MGGWGRALGTAIPQALSDITSMQNLAVQEDVNRRAGETHGQNIRMNEQVMQENTIKLKRAEMEQAEAEKLHKIQTTPQPTDALWNTPYMSQFAPKTTAKFMDDFNKSPYVTPQYGTDGKAITHYTSTPQLQMKYGSDNPMRISGFLNEGIAEINENIMMLTQTMQAEAKPEKQQQFKMQIDKLTTARTMLQQQSGGLQAELAKLEAQKETKETEKPEMTGNVVRDKDSETGWAYADKQGNIIARNAPMPSVYKPTQPAAVVNVSNRQETEEAKAVGKAMGEIFVDTQKSANESRKQLFTLNQLESYLAKVNTGKLTPTLKTLSEYADALGFKVNKNLGYAQAAESLTNQMALQLRNPAGGMGMPGSMSDPDREFLMKMPPGISKTKKGNELLFKALKGMHERSIEIAKKANQYRKKYGTFDTGFYDELSKEYSGKSLFNIPKGAILQEGKAAKDTGLPVYRLPNGQLWTP